VIGLFRRLLERRLPDPHEPDEHAIESVDRFRRSVEQAYRELGKEPPEGIYREVERAERVLKRDRRGT
jgi:hypothetical protein